MRSVHDRFVAVVAVTVVVALFCPVFAAQANHKPCLCQPAIQPIAGLARNTYVATVRYSDPDQDPPAAVNVYIDGTAYPMRLVKGRPEDGAHSARLTLSPGEHSHYFYAEDARGLSERFPRYGAKVGPFVGARRPLNRQPILTEGGVHTDRGSDRDIYTFTVRYKDPCESRRPQSVRVVVDGIVREMKLHSGKPTDGVYICAVTLPAGPHAYYFIVRDAGGDCVTLPRHGFLRGPEVRLSPNSPPVLATPKVMPPAGGHMTRYTYTVQYQDEDYDAPALALIYIDGFPHTMKLAASKPYNGLYVYRGYHHLGPDHKYHFYFEDGRGGTCRLPAQGSFHGPVVTR